MDLPRPPRARLVREIVPFVLLVCACGAAVTRTSEPTQPAAPPPSSAPPVAGASSAPDPAALAAFEALAAQGSTLAPGMREAARREGGADPVALVSAEGRDTCLRVAFAASVPVKARLVDAAGNVLAASGDPATDGVLGARGPVCVRRGDVVKGVAEGAGARVRWIAWEAR
jgi:hypothetical protein